MPTIIRDLPYFDQPTRVQVRGRSFSVKRDQIVVWIGITEKGIQDLAPRTPCFPAILDIGWPVDGNSPRDAYEPQN